MTNVPLARIDLKDRRFSLSYPPDDEDLRWSIATVGIVQPVILLDRTPRIPVAGWRRLRCARELRLREVPAIIVDGAGELTIFLRLVLPLSTSALATIGLFLILDYWNDWYHAMLYMSDYKKFPLQYMLYNLLSASEAIARLSRTASISVVEVPSRAVRMAMTVVATGPILLVYPFVQRYFVKGVTLGAVKG